MTMTFRLYALARAQLTDLIAALAPRELYYIGGPIPLPAPLTAEEERALLLFYIGSGTYGTSEQGALSLLQSYAKHNRVTFGTKMKYCFRRLFPEMHYYKLNHPTVYKYKILIPGFLFLRACKLLFKKPRQFFKELKLLVKTR